MQILQKCSQEEFEAIHAAVEKVRAGTECVKLPIEAVKNLLMDHSELYSIIGKL